MPTTRTVDPELVARGADTLTLNIRVLEGHLAEACAVASAARLAVIEHEARLEELRAALAATEVQYPIVDPVLAAAAAGQVADWEAEILDNGLVG